MQTVEYNNLWLQDNACLQTKRHQMGYLAV